MYYMPLIGRFFFLPSKTSIGIFIFRFFVTIRPSLIINMNIRYTKIATLIMSVALVGAGCTSLPLADCTATTAHGSCVSNGIDDALLGAWRLESQTIVAPAGSIVSPSSGRTLTFAPDGTYVDDYSTESIPDGSALSITSTCDVMGSLSGSYTVDSFVDLDVATSPTVDELHITPDGGSPKVVCQATGIAVTSNTASSPLGVGPVEGTPPYVNYTYSMTTDLNTLTIVQTNTIVDVQNVYKFVR